MSKNIIKFSLVAVLLLVGIYGYLHSRTPGIKSVVLAGQEVQVKAVSSPDDLTRGLAGVNNLDWNQGMLFLFPSRAQYQFWMKDMVMPIDIIWLRGNLVADITREVPPPTDLNNQTNLPLYSSREPIDSVLEVKSGFADRFKLHIGDSVSYK